MRVFVFLLVLSLAHSYAITSYSQQVKINLKMEGSNMETILEKIEKETNFHFFYQSEDLKNKETFDINAENKTVFQILDDILPKAGLSYEVFDKYIAINSTVKSTTGQIKVTGKVTDVTGAPLPGVTVVIKGTTNGTITNFDGAYTLSDIPSDGIIQFSFVGMKMQEIPVSGKASIDVIMEEDAIGIEEVVAVGYGTMKKSDLTGSVSQVKVAGSSEQISESFEQLLQGRTSGLDIIQTSGAPGAAILFNIRGANSLGSNQPLIVIDGYPIETDNSVVNTRTGGDNYTNAQPESNALAVLNPNEIESVEILKDASSTAIYGSRGANGVVLITTKRGKEGKDKLTYNFRSDISFLPRQMQMISGPEYIKYANEAAYNSNLDSVFNASRVRELAGINMNWQDLVYQTSYSQDHQLSFTGGDKKTKYAITGNYTGIDGIVKYSYYNKGGIRINLDRQFSDRFKMGVNFNTSLSKNQAALQSANDALIQNSVVSGALRYSPLNKPYNDLGDLDETLQNNPLLTLQNTTKDGENSIIIANVFAELKVTEDLLFRINGGFNQTVNHYGTYYGRGTYTGDLYGGQAYQGYSKNFNYLTEYTLNYKKQIKKHKINGVVGYTWQNWNSNSMGVIVKGFANDNLSYKALEYANSVNNPKSSAREWALASYLGRLNYNFENKYLATFTGRTDGSSRLAIDHKWAFFPSVALGWNAHNEDFFRNSTTISKLKLRASYGLSGNQSIGVGATQALLTSTRAAISSNNIITGISLSSFENPKLHWETTSQFNIGADIGLLKNIFLLTVDIYKKNTSDLLLNVSIPSDTGFSNYSSNGGEIENRGINIDMEIRPIEKEFQWFIGANFSLNRNKVIDLGENAMISGKNLLVNALSQSATVAMPGQPIGAFYGYKIVGIYQNETEVSNGPVDPVNPAPGDFKYADLSGPDGVPDGKITADDRTILGSPEPDFSFGLTNDLIYKNFKLSLFIQGSIGQEVANLNRYYSDGLVYPNSGNIRKEAWDNRWIGEGTSNYYPRPKMTGTLLDSRFSDFLLEDASFVRLKNINLSYTFPAKTFRYFSNLKLFVSATNLFVITNYKGYDPEVSIFGTNALNRNIDYGAIPNFRTYSCGLNITF